MTKPSNKDDTRRLLRVRCDINEATYNRLYQLLERIPRKSRAERLRVLAHIGLLAESGHPVVLSGTVGVDSRHAGLSASPAVIRDDFKSFGADAKEPG